MFIIGGLLIITSCAAAKKQPRVSPDASTAQATPGTTDDGPDEVLEETYPDGVIKTRMEGWRDVNGDFVKHGRLINYWENGQKKSEVHYVNGVRHGSRAAWYRDGKPWSAGQFVGGKGEGTWTEWYPNGSKGREMHFVGGGLNGPVIDWYPDGTLRKKVIYVKGMRQGRATHWDRTGTIIRVLDYVDDVPEP